MRLLLHTCCAPCTTFVNQDLSGKGLSLTGLFYNPNIQPEEEYERRKKTMEQYAALVGFNVFYEPGFRVGNPLRVAEVPVGLRGRPTRDENDFLTPKNCEQCYRVRLTKTAVLAKEQGFEAFSTTLLISPYQQHDLLKKLGEKIADEIGVDFYYNDWRPNFRQGQNLAKELGLYRQKYCGCVPGK